MSQNHEVDLAGGAYNRARLAALLGASLTMLSADAAIAVQDYLIPEDQVEAIVPSYTAQPAPMPALSPSIAPVTQPAHGFEVTCDQKAAETEPNPEIAANLAEDCLDIYSDTKIALVNYSFNPGVAELFAHQIEADVVAVTEGELHPDVTVVPASAAAELKLSQKTADGDCVDPNDTGDYSSYIADQIMPELGQYDRILGLSGLAACGDGDLGVAEPTKNRYAELFDVEAADIQAIADNNGQLTVTSQTGDAVVSAELNDPAQTAAHELLHLFGLGHSGLLTNSDRKDLQGWSLEDAPAVNNTLDLAAFINDGFFTEYGGSDVMGYYTQTEASNLALNSVEQSLLEWPQRLLNESSKVSVVDLSRKPFGITGAEADRQIAWLKLDEGYSMPKGDSLNTDFGNSQTYNQLAFSGVGTRDLLYGANVYLIGDHNNAVFLGALLNLGAGDTNYVIKSGQQIINVNISGDGSLQVTAKTLIKSGL